MNWWCIRYFDGTGEKAAIVLRSKTAESVVRRFRREVGFYEIFSISQIDF